MSCPACVRGLLFYLLLACPSLAVNACAQGPDGSLQIYPVPAVYATSTNLRLRVDGRNVPVTRFRKYETAQLAFGSGQHTVEVERVDGAAVRSASISPRRQGLTAALKGRTASFQMKSPEYLIVKVDELPELVLAVDPPQQSVPAAHGAGIFNVTDAPYGAVPDSGVYATAALQRALDEAAVWGTETRQGVVYVPAGVWTTGSLYLGSHTDLYLAPGAVLRFTGDPAHYRVDAHKDSQHRNLTWFVSTRPGSTGSAITGRGTIDGNGQATLKVGNLGVNLLAPICTDHFLVDGITFRESSSWGVIPTRSHDVTMRNIKIFNGLDMGENDGIDVVESQNVLVQNAIAISLDDPFSTKTWQAVNDMFGHVPGQPEPLAHVRFEHVIAWTRCYGFKVGQGVVQPQTDVVFEDGTVYDAAIGFGVHHKWGSATASGIAFRRIDVEHLCCTNDDNQTWMALWMANTPGPRPVEGVEISDIHVWDAGTTPARVNGMPGSPIRDVRLRNIQMPGTTSPATTFPAMHIVEDDFHENVEIEPAAPGRGR